MLGSSPTSAPPQQRSKAGFDVVFPFLLGLVLAASGIALQLRCFPIGDLDLETDFYGDLVVAARHLLEGRLSVADFLYKGPLYATVLVPFHALAGDWYRGAVLLSTISGGLALALGYRLVLHLSGRRVAFLSTLATPLVVEFFLQFHRASADLLFLALCVASIASTLAPGASRRRLALAGALAGLAFLTRYNGFFLVVGTLLALLVANPDRLERRRRVQAFAVYMLAFVLVCAPWFAVNGAQTGTILATRNAETVVAAFYGGPRWQNDPVTRSHSMLALVAAHPAYFAAHYVRNVVDHLGRDLSTLLGWPLCLVPLAGLLGLALRRPTRRQIAFYLFAAAYVLCMGIVFYAPRFFLPLVLPYLAFGFSSLQIGDARTTPWGRRLAGWCRHPDRRRAGWFLLASSTAALAVVQVHAVVTAERGVYARRPLDVLEAARALAAGEARAGGRILARKGHLAYYAGLDFVPFTTGIESLEDLVREAQACGATFVAYGKVEYSLLPRMLFIAITDSVPLLEEVYRAPSMRIFRIPSDVPPVLSESQRYDLLRANLRAARMQGRSTSIYLACSDLASFHLKKGEFAEAAAFFSDALEVAGRGSGEPEMDHAAAMARLGLARAELGLERPEIARSLLLQNLEFFRSAGSPLEVARTHMLLAHAYERMGREEDARRERRLAAPLSGKRNEIEAMTGVD
jgi:4-amino-4-deoxy-L-arabinose transferase-like glycosyltransferase